MEFPTCVTSSSNKYYKQYKDTVCVFISKSVSVLETSLFV